MIGAGISIHFYIEKHHEDVFDHRDPPPSFAVLYRSVKRAKNVVGAIFVIRSYWQHASEKGDWNDDPAIHPTLFRWSWLISDCKSSTWWSSGKRGHVDSSQHACCKKKHANIIRKCMLHN